LTIYQIGVIIISETRKTTNKEIKKMTKAERKVFNERVKEMVAQGVDKEMAKILARVEVEYGIIKPVVEDEIVNFTWGK